MNKMIPIFIIILAATFSFGQSASSNWGKLQKVLVIQPSLNISAWNDRSFVTNMVPVGDGTFEVKMMLTPGQSYNYLLEAKTGSNAPAGLPKYYSWVDQPPSIGVIPASRYPSTVEFTNVAKYGSVTKSQDARRILTVPYLAPGESLYVFNNFNASPKLPASLQALPGNGKAILNWSTPQGNWNADDINVLAGGRIMVYSSTAPDSNFILTSTLPGNATSYTQTGLVNGTTYYYILAVSDAYTQASNQPFENKSTPLPPPYGSASGAVSTTPRGTIPVYFKVENIKWEVVSNRNYLVWLTPAEEDARTYAQKIAGRITRVVVK